jgi:hypothetical protein
MFFKIGIPSAAKAVILSRVGGTTTFVAFEHIDFDRSL